MRAEVLHNSMDFTTKQFVNTETLMYGLMFAKFLTFCLLEQRLIAEYFAFMEVYHQI